MKTAQPTQRRLPIKLELECPLLDINAARGALDLSADDILALIDNGLLAWAWDIGLGARSEVRILAKCVRGFQASNSSCGLAADSFEKTIGYILARDTKPFIEGVRLTDLLNCHRHLIIDLIHEGDLKVLPGTSWRRGRDGTPAITRESIIQFFKQRRMK